MARRRSSKETYAQKVVELATSTLPLPTPVKSMANSRWGARLLLVLIPILIASGVVTISWTGGLPNITVNKDRAAVVGQEVQMEAMKAAERRLGAIKEREQEIKSFLERLDRIVAMCVNQDYSPRTAPSGGTSAGLGPLL